MGKVPGERRCHHTLNSTPGLTKHPLINKQWGEWLNIDPPPPSLSNLPSPWFSPSGRSLSRRRAEEEACPVLLRAGLLHVGFSTMESGTVSAAVCVCVPVCVRTCVCVCWQLTRCPLSMSSSVNRSRAVNTSPADGNDVKPTSHLISPLPALSSLTPSILFLINLCFCFVFFPSSLFSLYPLLQPNPTHSPDLSFSTLLTFSALLRHSRLPCFPASLSCPYVIFLSPNISMRPHLGAPVNTLVSSVHLFSSLPRTSIHSSVWFKLQDYFLLFPLKGRWISFHEPGEQEKWGEFETPRSDRGDRKKEWVKRRK